MNRGSCSIGLGVATGGGIIAFITMTAAPWSAVHICGLVIGVCLCAIGAAIDEKLIRPPWWLMTDEDVWRAMVDESD